MQTAYIVDAIRTPIGKYAGILSTVRPDDLLAQVIRALVQRNASIDPAAIEEIIAGAANQSGEDNRNVARMAALLAGLPITVGGVTVNRLCASGLDAIIQSARAIQCGDGMMYIAGGVESMSRAPFVMPKSSSAFERNAEIYDTTMGWRFINKKLAERYFPFTMGETAENVATQWNIGREAQDLFAVNSQEKYAGALAAGKWEAEMAGIEIIAAKGEKQTILKDEHPRLSTMDQLAKLKPVFKKDGTVTAANSSGINDGAAAMLLVNEAAIKQFNLEPMARVVSMAISGVDPSVMGIGPVPASQKALQRAGLSVSDLDLIELNEAFASQSLACISDLRLDPAKVNVNGGAIALGHPLGCSGVRISTTLLHELKRRGGRYGLATMCIGVGQGAAVVYENLG
ncbi:MAG: acetyl-CoA C-acyltransferase [Bacteroidota bacterium]